MAHLREIGIEEGREGGRDAEEETRMRKKIEAKEWRTQVQKNKKRSVCERERVGSEKCTRVRAGERGMGRMA